jgi:hypothetical protein
MVLRLDSNYFKSKAGNILPQHLDNQFNAIATYINNDLIDDINTMSITVTQGVLGAAGAVFCNLADNTVGYSYLNDLHFDDGFISLSKLQKQDPSSIFVSDWLGNITNFLCTDDNQLLFGTPVMGFEYRKITTADLDLNVIDGSKLGVLSNDNFEVDTFINALMDLSVNENNLRNISNDKIALGVVGFRHIGVFDDLPYDIAIARQLLLADFEDKAITHFKIKNNTIKWTNFVSNKPIEHYHIKDSSIVEGHFPLYNQTVQPPNIINEANLANFGAFINFTGMPQVHNNIKLTNEKLNVNVFKKEHFDAEVQAAITEYIRLKNAPVNIPVVNEEKLWIDDQFWVKRNIEVNFMGSGDLNGAITMTINVTSPKTAALWITGSLQNTQFSHWQPAQGAMYAGVSLIIPVSDIKNKKLFLYTTVGRTQMYVYIRRYSNQKINILLHTQNNHSFWDNTI